MRRSQLVEYLNAELRLAEFDDSSKNGLQVDGPEEVTRVALAVDASLAAFRAAAGKQAQLLIVHHGMFWARPVMLTGPAFRRVKALIDGGVGLYAAHLPLDAHPKFGNNIELCRRLGLRKIKPFGNYHKMTIGFAGELPRAMPLSAMVDCLRRATGAPAALVLDGGPKRARRIGCVSGGAADMVEQAAAAGLDTYVTGETSHSYFHSGPENNVNVIYGGHYATETTGIRALGRRLQSRFRLETVFLDIPTGL